jgi:hypothetical protein
MVIRINNKQEWKDVQNVLFELDCVWNDNGLKLYWNKYESLCNWHGEKNLYLIENEKRITWSWKQENYILASVFLRKYKLRKLNYEDW